MNDNRPSPLPPAATATEEDGPSAALPVAGPTPPFLDAADDAEPGDAADDQRPDDAAGGPAQAPEGDAPVSPRPQRLLTRTGPPLVTDSLQEQDLLHESAMTASFGLLLSLLARVLFKPVRFPPRINNALTDCAREGVPVYLMNTVSRLDYLYFNFALRRAGLPLAHFANHITIGTFHPWRSALRFWWRRLRRREPLDHGALVQGLLRRRRSVLLFLRRGFSFAQLTARRPSTTHLSDLIAAQRQVEFPIFVVPQVLVWERRPDTDGNNILDAFFGDPDAPGPLRKAFSFVFNHRRAFVQLGEVIDLQAFLLEHDGEQEDSVLAERLRVRIVQHFKREERVIRGGRVKSPGAITDEILASASMEREIAQIAQTTGRDAEALTREARSSLMEIAANLQLWMIESFSLILTLVWARIYEGIELDEEGLERIKEAGRDTPVAVVPCHKSHIDYLIISYLFYRNGVVPPYIAAGANLSFFPMGLIFRLSGAFFLRRSFRGDAVYTACFKAYVRKLLADGNWLEFFIEGTRSRTGKLIPPKYGLLRHVAEAVADGDVPDVTLAPVNFGYERLVEERSYRKELEGGEKRSEGVGELLSASKVLVHKYGRMRVQFGETLSMRELLLEHGVLAPAGHRDEADFTRAVKVCGYRILNGINRASVITPTALVAAVLLSKVGRGISRGDLLLRVGYLLDTASRRGAVLSGPLQTAIRTRRQKLTFASTQEVKLQQESGGLPDPLGKQAARARVLGEAMEHLVDGALHMFEAGKWIARKRFDEDDVYVVKRAGRLHLDYYKNNIIHVFAPDALFAAALLSVIGPRNTFDSADLQLATQFLSLLLKFEFVYDPGLKFDEQFQRTLDHYIEDGWIKIEDGGMRLRDKVTPVVHLYAKLVQNFVESYMLMGKALTVLGKGPMTDKNFVAHCQSEAAREFELGEVQCYESCSKVNLSNALRIFIEQRYIQQRRETIGKKTATVLDVEVGERTGAQFAAFVDRIESFHRPWRVGQR